MTSLEIKQLLDEKYQEYCHSDFFIHTDPIQIPKLFEEKEDIEIAVDNIPFDNIGFGSRNSMKIELALKNNKDTVSTPS